ncbi:MAG: sigma-54-dependent Fis family transcriptional regulator [Bacteroidetes bacterium]|nr:sigma-54-dependent Fis family transcriptional regulator [Bacteroidota bacterium]
MDNLNTQFRRNFQLRYGIIGESNLMQDAISMVEKVAPTDLPVLINGETGTGKEVFANAIHNLSLRKSKPFVSVNCGAIPDTLLEAELFGHEKGAFTNAVEQRVGFFEAANNGTIFLDEVGEMPIVTQVKLLRILETGEYSRLGSSAIRKVNVRIIAATNRNLEQEVLNKNFRQDLFYRLNTVNIVLPALREHPEDIPLYINYFAEKICRQNSIQFLGFTDDAIKLLKGMRWPGNIRELKNFVEKVVTLEHGKLIDKTIIKKYLFKHDEPDVIEEDKHINTTTALVSTVKQDIVSSEALVLRTLLELKQDITDIKRALAKLGAEIGDIANDVEVLKDTAVVNYTENVVTPMQNITLEEQEKRTIIERLNEFYGNKRKTAQSLGISERTLHRKLKEYGMND